MAEVITIISLSAILVAFIIYHIFTTNKLDKIINDQQLDYMRMCDKHQASVDSCNNLSKNYSESLDKHEKAYDELNNRYIIAQAQIEAKDLEIIGLESKISILRESIDKYSELLNGVQPEIITGAKCAPDEDKEED